MHKLCTTWWIITNGYTCANYWLYKALEIEHYQHPRNCLLPLQRGCPAHLDTAWFWTSVHGSRFPFVGSFLCPVLMFVRFICVIPYGSNLFISVAGFCTNILEFIFPFYCYWSFGLSSVCVTNRASVNLIVQVYAFLLCVCLGVELLTGHAHFSICRSCKTISSVVVPVDTPTSGVWELQLLSVLVLCP